MICVDASLAVKWIVTEEASDLARALYDSATQMGQRIVAPPLLPIEVTNILRKRIRRTSLSTDEAIILMNAFLSLPIELHNPPGIHQRARALAAVHNLPRRTMHTTSLWLNILAVICGPLTNACSGS